MRVLVVGDVILDEYTHGNPIGISAETPTVVAELNRVEKFVGGAGLVVRHLLRLGCHVNLLTAAESGKSIESELLESSDAPSPEEINRFQCNPFVVDGWKFTQKKRYFVDSYKMVQYDVLNKMSWADHKDRRKTFCSLAKEIIEDIDVVVICDNRHGVLNYNVGPEIVRYCNIAGIRCFVDSQVSQKESNLSIYKGADYFFVNERELRSFTCLGPETDLQSNMNEARRELVGDVIVKLGSQGAARLDIFGKLNIYPTTQVNAIDTCGAGDAFLSAFVVKCDIMEANMWATLSTTYKGTIVPRITNEQASLSR